VSGLRGLVLGVAGLAMAEAVVSNQKATNNAGGAITLISHGLARWLDPYTPLIPDLRAGAAKPAGPGKVWGGIVPKTPAATGGTPMQPVSTTPGRPGSVQHI
jgi:hypothetical protein